MNDQMDDAVTGIDRPGYRVDEERHVVVDDFDDRMWGRPAVGHRVRVMHSDLGLSRTPAFAEVPQLQGCSIEIAGAPLSDVRGRHVSVKFRNEALGGRSF